MKTLRKRPTKANKFSGKISITHDELCRVEVGVTKLIVLDDEAESGVLSAPTIEQWMIDGLELKKNYDGSTYLLMPYSQAHKPVAA